MKVMLVFPPPWTPAMPHLALPVLTAALRGHGVAVSPRDLNLETYAAVLTRDYLLGAIERLKAQHPRVKGPRRAEPGKVSPDALRWAWQAGPALAARIAEAVQVFRSPAFYDGERSRAAFLDLTQALELASLPYFPARLDLLGFESDLPIDSSRDLAQAARDAARNPFIDIFRRVILPDIMREQPDIVGVSIPTRSQMLPAMTLAALVKDAGLPAHVTVGGPHISMLRGQLPHAAGVWGLIDSAVVFDGEGPLVALADALAGNGDLAAVSNLIYKAADGVRVNPAAPAKASDRLPDFDGLPLDRYLAPELILPLITSHGCYHGRCAFCNVGYGAEQGFHALPAEQVLEQVAALHARYGVRHIFFADEAIPPRTLRALSAGLTERGAPVHWCGCARFDRPIEGLLPGMAEGGCRMLLFGLETGSARLTRHMVKGTEGETTRRILRASAAAGIWNHAFFFFGFPTETLEDAQETVNFLYGEQSSLHSASAGVFVLERHSPAHVDPERFGITQVVERPDADLAIYFDYETASGLDEDMARTIMERLVDNFPAKRWGQYYVSDAYRFLYASYLRGAGRGCPVWLGDE